MPKPIVTNDEMNLYYKQFDRFLEKFASPAVPFDPNNPAAPWGIRRLSAKGERQAKQMLREYIDKKRADLRTKGAKNTSVDYVEYREYCMTSRPMLTFPLGLLTPKGGKMYETCKDFIGRAPKQRYASPDGIVLRWYLIEEKTIPKKDEMGKHVGWNYIARDYKDEDHFYILRDMLMDMGYEVTLEVTDKPGEEASSYEIPKTTGGTITGTITVPCPARPATRNATLRING